MFHLLLRCFHLITRFSGGEFDGVKLENVQTKLILKVVPLPFLCTRCSFLTHCRVCSWSEHTSVLIKIMWENMCSWGVYIAWMYVTVRLKLKERSGSVESFELSRRAWRINGAYLFQLHDVWKLVLTHSVILQSYFHEKVAICLIMIVFFLVLLRPIQYCCSKTCWMEVFQKNN